MDGKHVTIQTSFNSGSVFYNYKSIFSIVLHALVDADYNFIFVDIGCQGRILDEGVYKNTTLYRKLENNDLGLPHVIGDIKQKIQIREITIYRVLRNYLYII